jgi:malonate transporter and related proteins
LLLAVIEAFGVIAVVVVVGIAVGRTGVLGDNARMVLNRAAFHIGVPALLVVNLADARLDQVFSVTLLISAVVALAVFGVFFAVAVRRRSRGEAAVSASAASMVNAGNLGLPLSAYVFGGTTEISSIILFQSVVMVPLSLAILDSESGVHRSPGQRLVAMAATPIVAASAVGIALAVTGIDIPRPLHDPLELLGALAIPTVLIAFGISLSARDDRPPQPHRAELVWALAAKTVVMPVLAYALARWCFGADPHHTTLVTVLAALPSAQNINTYAAVYRRGEGLARDATLVSTVLSVPVITGIVAFTG